jgi:anti-sigma factor RsiW
MKDPNDFTCNDARPLVPLYLDGELTADRASPLRRHLMDCSSCRTATQVHKAQQGWFVPTPEIKVPTGFASRVARRAFQGDTGEQPLPDAVLTDAVLAPVLPFVLKMTAAAAGLLLVLSGVLRSVDVPTGGELRADDASTITLDDALERLESLNADESRGAGGKGR